MGAVCKCNRVDLYLKDVLVFVVKGIAKPPERSRGLALRGFKLKPGVLAE